jgi:hypothetical protein
MERLTPAAYDKPLRYSVAATFISFEKAVAGGGGGIAILTRQINDKTQMVAARVEALIEATQLLLIQPDLKFPTPPSLSPGSALGAFVAHTARPQTVRDVLDLLDGRCPLPYAVARFCYLLALTPRGHSLLSPSRPTHPHAANSRRRRARRPHRAALGRNKRPGRAF